MIKTIARVAAKLHLCESCRDYIRIGDIYLHHTAAPNAEDIGNERWLHSSECRDCADRYGRGGLITAREGS
jgi:hypothetical protein